MTVHYIAEYEPENNRRELSGSPAGTTKMNYIIKTLLNCGLSIAVFSTSHTMASGKFYGIRKIIYDKTYHLILRSTFSAHNKYTRMVERLWSQLQLLLYGLFGVSGEDIMLLYHERYYLSVINLIKKIKKITVIYEVEEIYTIAAGCQPHTIQKEIKGLQCADAYLLVNDIMANKLGFTQKPAIISYGTFRMEERRYYPPEDGMIHIVYAGTLDPIKAGAITAVRTAEYLNHQYHMHILGFGSNQEIAAIRNEMDQVMQTTACKITYEGCLKGEQYIRFLQNCHIGLNAQNPEEDFNDYSFPSKILTYMANGLLVVATHIEALEKSSIGHRIVFAKDSSPQALASAIKSAGSPSGEDYQFVIAELDRKFNRELKLLMQRF